MKRLNNIKLEISEIEKTLQRENHMSEIDSISDSSSVDSLYKSPFKK